MVVVRLEAQYLLVKGMSAVFRRRGQPVCLEREPCLLQQRFDVRRRLGCRLRRLLGLGTARVSAVAFAAGERQQADAGNSNQGSETGVGMKSFSNLARPTHE